MTEPVAPTRPPAARPPADHGAPSPDDATLVGRVAGGDRGAFEALYERHRTPLFRTALAVTRDRGTAEELLQEAFLRAYRHIGRVTLAPGASLRPWLHRILINLSYDWSARRRTAAGAMAGSGDRFLPSPLASPEREAEVHEVQRVVAEAINALPFKQRIVVILFYLHDMDLMEVSATLNVPPGTVKSRMYYARARLRKQLEGDARLPLELEVRYVSA